MHKIRIGWLIWAHTHSAIFIGKTIRCQAIKIQNFQQKGNKIKNIELATRDHVGHKVDFVKIGATPLH